MGAATSQRDCAGRVRCSRNVRGSVFPPLPRSSTSRPHSITPSYSPGARLARGQRKVPCTAKWPPLSAPLGFKNPTSGKLKTAVDAIVVAGQSHKFPSISLDGRAIVVTTTGNPDCHLILRGGDAGTNYDAASVGSAAAALDMANVIGRVMIDCSHANSGGDYRRQYDVAADIARQIAARSRRIFGIMLESHLVEGRQDPGPDLAALKYGQSVTDACIGWEMTVEVLDRLANAVRARRRQGGWAGDS